MGSYALPTLKKADYASAQSEAQSLLDELGIAIPPVDPVKIAQHLGVAVQFVEFRGDSDRTVSGFYDFEENVIVINKHEYPLRQTFTVAHELGHKVLHETWAKSESYSVFLRDPSQVENNPVEQEANAFAAALLMPRLMMDEYYQLPAHKLSSLFAVSVPAVKARLQFLYGI